MTVRTLWAISLTLTAMCPLTAQERSYHFYGARPYGSDALFNPISLLANGGLDTYQIIDDRSPTLDAAYWNPAVTNVWRSITSPADVVRRFGTARFFRKEVFPTSFNIEDAQYVPNFVLHTVGGGMLYRKATEWYDYHGFPLPALFGVTTRIAFELANEAVENGPDYYPNEDCIPDVLIFQPLGILLFSFDGVSEFFSSTLSLNEWSQPAIVTFHPFMIRNAGQNFVMKYPLDRSRASSLFFHFGDFAILGLSLKTNSEDAVSFGAGLASTGTRSLPVENDVPSNTVVVGGMAGVYYDRNNSLLASIVYSDVQNNRLRVNIYPGLLPGGTVSPGVFVTIGQHGTIVAGVTASLLPLGLGFYSPR
ncbi:MAG TPA: hypothetical protein VMM37_04895 [Bacteroidota bacterium]|nr:hypothetical protein [Bacteroidota bacterium]